MNRPGLAILAALSTSVGGTACAARAAAPAPTGYAIVADYPHDSAAYTQGLVYRPGGTLLESTGLYGQSDIRQVELKTGRAARRVTLPKDRFGEGLALLRGKLFQLTWQSGIAYRYDEASFALEDSLRYPGEGWGLTNDSMSLILSDGTDTLRFLDPATFAVHRKLPVRFSTQAPVGKLNELEYANGEIFANVYQSDWILRIDAASGEVLEVLDLSGLLPAYNAGATSENVLNGIAIDQGTGHLYVTGKRWPRLFELRLDRAAGVKH